MITPAPAGVLRAVYDAAEGPRLSGLPDTELLRRFALGRDEAAFLALLRRHGPMVLGVCRAVLPNPADAEDAFQATFLVLARSARAIRRAGALASWLHGVASRTARKARAAAVRRRECERQAAVDAAAPDHDLAWRDVRRAIHEELDQLSDRYRGPLTLCYLQGRTLDQAAAQLGLAKGTLRSRLERGRAVLRARLVRRGLGPAAVLLAAAWPAAGEVPAALVGPTVAGALRVAAGQSLAPLVPDRILALTDGVHHAMFAIKQKAVAAILILTTVTGLGLGGLAYSTPQPGPPAEGGKPHPPVTVVHEEVKGSIHHGGGKTTWYRITGKAKVIDARTLEFEDGTRVVLDIVTPDLDQLALNGDRLYPCGKDAAEFVRTLIGDRPVMCFSNAGRDDERAPWSGYAGDANIERALILSGWALADHSSLHADEVIARENKRGLWRGRFVHPDDWRAGVRLPQEPSPAKLTDERQVQALIDVARRSPAALSALVDRLARDLPDVRRLDFTQTNLTDHHLRQLTRLTGLERLCLADTQVTDAGLAYLKSFPRLKNLSLPACTAAGMAHLKALPGLTYLDLRWVHVTDEGLAHIAGLGDLEELHAGWAAVTDAGLRHLSGLHRMRRLTVFNTKVPQRITDAGLAHLSGLKGLVFLNVDGAAVTDDGLAHLKQLDRLEYLDLNASNVTDTGVQQLAELKRLRVLILPERVTAPARAQLQTALPGLRFDGKLGASPKPRQ